MKADAFPTRRLASNVHLWSVPLLHETLEARAFLGSKSASLFLRAKNLHVSLPSLSRTDLIPCLGTAASSCVQLNAGRPTDRELMNIFSEHATVAWPLLIWFDFYRILQNMISTG